ncbi:hypothetical protein GF358_01090 [Candidatus Woesearchaeota archaeon]|nr:hypothetical protein [Candidatus Woesearchaeota archaeon]
MFKKSFFLIKDSFGYFLACIGIDVLFFIALGFFTAPFSAKMRLYLVQIAGFFSQNMQELGRGSFLTALFNPETMSLWKLIFWQFLLFLAVMYLVYVVLQSVVWNLSLKLAKKNISYLVYVKKFALVNIFWFVLFILYGLLDLIGDLNQALNPDVRFNFFSVFASFFVLVLGYFVVISYSTLKVKKSFVIGWKHNNFLFSRYFVVILYFFILNFVLARLAEINYILAVSVGLIFFLPAVAFARVWMAANIQRVE